MALSNGNPNTGANSVHYAGIFRFFPDAVTLTRASDGILLDANEEFERLSGYRRTEVVGSRTSQLGCWLDPGQWEEVHRMLEARGEVRDLDTQILCRDGRLASVLMTLRRLEIEGERCYVAAVRDITQHKQTKKTLRESEEKFVKSFSANPSILSISTIAEGRYIEVNEAFLRVTGFVREEIIGRTAIELNIWETPEARARFIRTLQKEGSVRELEARFRSKCGELIIGLLSAEVIEIKGEGFLLILLDDLTECKRSENALLESKRLLESEKRFRSLFEHMMEGAAYCQMLFDDNGRPADFIYLDVNNAFSESTGLYDVIGKKVSELLPGLRESAPELFELYGRVASTGRPEKCEIHIKQLSFWRSMSVYSREKGYFVAVSENITDRKLIEAELRESHHKLQELTAHLNLRRERELKAFARKVHDELGTSLTLLKFDLAWIKRNYPTDKKAVAERIRAMDELIHECTRTIQRITLELRPALLDEQGLAATIEWHAKEFEKRSGISCRFEVDTAAPSLSQDISINVFRIFQESLSNVLRHAGATSVKVSLVKAGERLVLRIMDNGAGISKQEVSAPTSFGILGMEERARLCGGAIIIKGIPGKGTTISLSIPA